MNRSWVRFPQAAQMRPPGSGWAFLYALRAGLLCAPVGGGVPASRPRREPRSARRLEARPGPAATIVVSHVIPHQLVQTLNVYRWDCNVFGWSRKVTVGNYVRNLSGGGPANPCWPYQPAAACTTASPFGFSGAFRTGRVVLSWLAPTLPRVRYKILPARLLGGDNGTKLSLHAEKAPNWAISGVLGEFCTGSGAVRLVLGEFCTEGVRCGCCWANNVLL